MKVVAPKIGAFHIRGDNKNRMMIFWKNRNDFD
jgi:hypothetical protein